MRRRPAGRGAAEWTARRLGCAVVVWALLGAPGALPAAAERVDTGVIRLGGAGPSGQTAEPQAAAEPERLGGEPRGFDYEGFLARLEALWFQRKAFLADGREGDAARQAELIRSFCAEQGVRRLQSIAGALLAEAARYVDEGDYARALESIALAEKLDPGRPAAHVARATVYWKSGRSYLRAAAETGLALQRSVVRSARDLSLANRLTVMLIIALFVCLGIFSLLMVVRHQLPLRHEVEEALLRRGLGHWAGAAGWGVLLLPFVVWVGAGWVAIYWIVATFRFMRRSERAAAISLLAATALAMPTYGVAVALYGVTADPTVRTTLASAAGDYDPDRVVELKRLVDSHPDDPTYRFLLAGLYKSGGYLEQAYHEYRRVLTLDPSVYQAHINVGNILYATGQYPAAISSYLEALALQGDSVLALYNLHLAHSEAFHFREAKQALARARAIDPRGTGEIMQASKDGTEDARAVDASITLGSLWRAALEGRQFRQGAGAGPAGPPVRSVARRLLNPLTLVALFALVLCTIIAAASGGRRPANRCIRCGGPFCHHCRSGEQGQEYCSQCLHLFVIGDGLAPETKTRKLYEVERHRRLNRNLRRLLSLVVPGTAQLLRGRAGLGCLLMLAWLTALLAWRPVAFVPLQRLIGVDLRLDLLDGGPVPALYSVNPTAALALIAALAVWFGGNLWRWRGREA